MAAVAPGDALSALNPILDTYTASGHKLADPYALAFQVYDVRDDTVPPVLVFPTTPNTRQPVDLVADRVGLGHFAAAWTVPGGQVPGRYQIRWYLTQALGAAERTWRRDFEVVAQVFDAGARTYALIADVRDEGVGPQVRDRRIANALVNATEKIEMWTGRIFAPVYKAVRLDGMRSNLLLLGEPLCALESLVYAHGGEPVDPERFMVYARHLSENLVKPDDRDSPKIEFIRYDTRGIVADVFPFYPLVNGFDLYPARFTRGLEYLATGVFGYSDFEANGAPCGVQPRNIRRACVLIALRELPKDVSQPDQAFDARTGFRIIQQRTREQTIQWSPRLASDQIAPYTGDPEIDSILLTYQNPLAGTGL